MNKEERHDLHLARTELNYFSALVFELNKLNIDWEEAKKEMKVRCCEVNEETEDIEEEHKQVDIFATFCAFTLVENKGRLGIGYGWSYGDRQTDLYEWGVGDFRPYYDEESKKDWLEKVRGN